MPKIEYKCSLCDLEGYRLFRECDKLQPPVYLLCVDCLERKSGEKFDAVKPYSVGGHELGCSHRRRVVFFAFADVPVKNKLWYYALPLRPDQPEEEYLEDREQLFEPLALHKEGLWDEALIYDLKSRW